MTAPSDDGGAMDPRIARVLLLHREAVAQATERAGRDLRNLGIDDWDVIEQLLVGGLDKRRVSGPR